MWKKIAPPVFKILNINLDTTFRGVEGSVSPWLHAKVAFWRAVEAIFTTALSFASTSGCTFQPAHKGPRRLAQAIGA